jgi:DNA-binding NarL/FixJ family response regulator
MKSAASQPGKKARILIADDHPLLRVGVGQLINRQADLMCCAEAETAEATWAAVQKHKPDLLLLDLRLDKADGLELIKSLRAQVPDLPILVLSQFDEALYAERALRAGARGYVMKQEATEEVLTAIRAILKGELYVSRKMAVLALHKSLQTKSGARCVGIENLTDRELQVFQLIGAGMSTREIAAELKVSFKTVETHRENIKHKLGLHSAQEIVRSATMWVNG